MDNFSLQNWRIRVLHEDSFREGMGELNVYGYQTQHFDICPGAQNLYKRILAGDFTDGVPSVPEQDKLVIMAKLHDKLFGMEKIALQSRDGVSQAFADEAAKAARGIMAMAKSIDLEDEHGYIQNHVDIIKSKVMEGAIILPELDEDKKERMAALIKQRDALIKKHSDAGEMFSDKVYDLDSEIQKIAKSESLNEIELEIPGDEKAPAGDKVLNKKLTKNDKIIAAYKEIEQEIKDSIQKIKTGNELEKKVAMDFLKSNQDTIKAYNNLKKV